MTKTEVIAIARDVGMCGMLTDVVCTIDELERFAALVAAAEREACAKVCDELAKMAATPESAACWMRLDCAAAIRKRGAA